VNVFYLLQFPLIALTALWTLRRLRVPTWPAIACAVLYSLAPYHFYRGELHLWLAGYWAVPLGLFLVLKLLMGEPPARFRASDPAPGEPLGLAGLAVLCVIVGTYEVYFPAMTVILLLLAA
jgi:phosphoglycerol transferase